MGEEMDQGARKTLPVFGDRGHSRRLLTFTTLNVTKADVQFCPPSPSLVAFILFQLFPPEPPRFPLWSLLLDATPLPHLFLYFFFF